MALLDNINSFSFEEKRVIKLTCTYSNYFRIQLILPPSTLLFEKFYISYILDRNIYDIISEIENISIVSIVL